MTRCASEHEDPSKGHAWRDPAPLPLRVETDRLIVRAYEPGDVEQTFEVISGCRESLLPWLPWARTEHLDIASTMEFIGRQSGRARKPLQPDGIAQAIFDKRTGELLGGTGFHDLRRDTASVEIGYWLRGDRRGRGYITEGVGAWITRLLTPQHEGGFGLRRIRIYCSADNLPSQGVPTRLGMRQEVHQRLDYFVPEHGITDRLGWGVMADEWDTERNRVRAG